jgi:hypothetical protein
MHSSGLTATQLVKPQHRLESSVVDPGMIGEFHANPEASMSGVEVNYAFKGGRDAGEVTLQVHVMDPSRL